MLHRNFVALILGLAVLSIFPVWRTSYAQQALPKRGTSAWMEHNRKMIQDAIEEKTHLPTTIPDSVLKRIVRTLGNKEHLEVVDTTNVIVASNVAPESEVHAAMNPTDSANIVVCPMKLGASGLLMPIYYTKDFGKSWNQSLFQTVPLSTGALVAGGGDPILTFDATGKLYLSWIDIYLNGSFDSEFSAIMWASSTNGGATFTRSPRGFVALSAGGIGAGGISAFEDKEWMTVDRSGTASNNYLYAAYTNLDVINGSHIQLCRKLPQSDSFETAINASPDSLSNVQFSSIGVDKSGGVHVTYMATIDGAQFALYHCLSTDHGQSIQSTVKIANADIPNMSPDAIGDSIPGVLLSRNYPCPHLSIDTASANQRMYFVWSALGTTSNQQHGTDIYFSSSVDGGTTWSKAKVLNDDTVIGWVDHFYPSIAVNGKGVITVTWYDRRSDPTNDYNTYYYMSQSFNHGKTWTPNVPVATNFTDFSTVGRLNRGFGVGEYTQVLTTENYTIPVWADGRNGDGDLAIYAAFLPIVPSTVGVKRLETVSSQFQLFDLYPNPATQLSTFSYRLGSPSHVKFSILNLLGESVAVLENGFKSSGTYQIPFSASTLPSGSYYYRLDTDFGTSSRMFVIAK